jgi:hypothetical protein
VSDGHVAGAQRVADAAAANNLTAQRRGIYFMYTETESLTRLPQEGYIALAFVSQREIVPDPQFGHTQLPNQLVYKLGCPHVCRL